MSVGYLSIIILRNRPSDVHLVDFDADSPNYKVNENTYVQNQETEPETYEDDNENDYENDAEYENDVEYDQEYDYENEEIERIDHENYMQGDDNLIAYENEELAAENLNNNEDLVEQVSQYQQEEKEEADIIDNTEYENLENSNENAIQEEEECENNDDDDNEIKIGRLQRIKMLFSYPFFIAICLAYFLVSLVKTLYSDWSQLYLRQSIQVDPYNGN